MLTQEANDRLTRVGPGTPMGNLLRRYWFPISTMAALDKEPVLPVEILGEHLTLFRGEDGKLGLVGDRCPHRATPLKYGIKNIKRIGTIRFSDQRPADYWAERGYDWYAGH